jgi:hypothetical protein
VELHIGHSVLFDDQARYFGSCDPFEPVTGDNEFEFTDLDADPCPVRVKCTPGINRKRLAAPEMDGPPEYEQVTEVFPPDLIPFLPEYYIQGSGRCGAEKQWRVLNSTTI